MKQIHCCGHESTVANIDSRDSVDLPLSQRLLRPACSRKNHQQDGQDNKKTASDLFRRQGVRSISLHHLWVTLKTSAILVTPSRTF